MRCVARELARFHLSQGASPDQELLAFVPGRCGASTSGVSMAWIDGTVPDAPFARSIDAAIPCA